MAGKAQTIESAANSLIAVLSKVLPLVSALPGGFATYTSVVGALGLITGFLSVNGHLDQLVREM